MEPIQLLMFAGSLAAGLLLGYFYFGLLWLTVRRLPHSRHPALLVQLSLFGRLVVVVPAFALVMQGQWQRLGFCLLGFLIVRQVMIVRIRPAVPVPLERAESGRA